MPYKIENYVCSKTLGTGISAKVKLAVGPDGKKVALKVYDKSSPENNTKAMETLKKEVEVYKNLNHPYMVSLVDYNDNAVKITSEGKEVPVAYMALELITGGELFDFVAIRAFGESISRYYFK